MIEFQMPQLFRYLPYLFGLSDHSQVNEYESETDWTAHTNESLAGRGGPHVTNIIVN